MLIRHIRQQAGFSQRELAELVGMDQAAISRIETGKQDVTVGQLVRIADALEVTITELLEEYEAA